MNNPFQRKPKRIRTAFTPGQLLRLEHEFDKNHYVVGAERKQLAHTLKLTETQVSIEKVDKLGLRIWGIFVNHGPRQVKNLSTFKKIKY